VLQCGWVTLLPAGADRNRSNDGNWSPAPLVRYGTAVSNKGIFVPFDSREMSRRGRIGGYAQKARHDPRETTRKARESFRARFYQQVDPDGVLPDAERERYAEAALKAHMARLARLSANARRRGG
jgi:hypothetical protein